MTVRGQDQGLVAQYSAYEPVPGYHVNGELTLGENIGDNSGLAIAYKAYQLSLGGKPAPVIDGMTGRSAFLSGLGTGMARQGARRMRRFNGSPSTRIRRPRSRGATLRQSAGVSIRPSACKPGDKMYLAPAERVEIW
jgi:putative endopeptidase